MEADLKEGEHDSTIRVDTQNTKIASNIHSRRTGKKTPAVTIDGRIAQGHVSKVRQEKMMTKKATVVGETTHQKQGEEGVSERRSSIRENQGVSNTDNGGREDAVRCIYQSGIQKSRNKGVSPIWTVTTKRW